MRDHGPSYARFQRSLRTGNLDLVRAAAAELPVVALDDALAILLLYRDREPERFDRVALRWLARFVTERARQIADVQAAAAALERLRVDPEDALARLQALTR
jgi:hypothetical protein